MCCPARGPWQVSCGHRGRVAASRSCARWSEGRSSTFLLLVVSPFSRQFLAVRRSEGNGYLALAPVVIDALHETPDHPCLLLGAQFCPGREVSQDGQDLSCARGRLLGNRMLLLQDHLHHFSCWGRIRSASWTCSEHMNDVGGM